jgi:hypothetical protein
VAATA